MAEEPENNGSASQDDWIEIANHLREGLKGKSENMQGALPSEWFDFTRAVRDVMAIEIIARNFDSQTEKESQPWTK